MTIPSGSFHAPSYAKGRQDEAKARNLPEPPTYVQGYRLGYMEGCAEGDRRTKAIQPDLSHRESVLVLERLKLERQCAALRGELASLVDENAAHLARVRCMRDNALDRAESLANVQRLTLAELAELKEQNAELRRCNDNQRVNIEHLLEADAVDAADMSNLRKELHAQNERVEKLHFAAEQDKVIWERQAAIIREQREQLAKIGELCKS